MIGFIVVIVVEAEVAKIIQSLHFAIEMGLGYNRLGFNLLSFGFQQLCLRCFHPFGLLTPTLLQAAASWLYFFGLYSLDSADCVAVLWIPHQLYVLDRLFGRHGLHLLHFLQPYHSVSVHSVRAYRWSLKVFNFIKDGTGVLLTLH